jgi:hypothetical protein
VGPGTRAPHRDEVLTSLEPGIWAADVVHRPSGAGRLPLPAAAPRRTLPDPLLASRPVNPDPPSPMLMIKERLLSAWLAYRHLTQLSFPRRFPIVQFPNLPLIVAFLAGEAGKVRRRQCTFLRRVSVLPGDDDMGVRRTGAWSQLVPAAPGTGLRDSPGRAHRPRVAHLICIADVVVALRPADFLHRLSPSLSPGPACPRGPACPCGLTVPDRWRCPAHPLAARRQKRPAIGTGISRRLVNYPQRPTRQRWMTGAGCRRGSAGNGYLMPKPAVQVDVIAVGLAGGGISDVGVQGMALVGGLRRAV